MRSTVAPSEVATLLSTRAGFKTGGTNGLSSSSAAALASPDAFHFARHDFDVRSVVSHFPPEAFCTSLEVQVGQPLSPPAPPRLPPPPPEPLSCDVQMDVCFVVGQRGDLDGNHESVRQLVRSLAGKLNVSTSGSSVCIIANNMEAVSGIDAPALTLTSPPMATNMSAVTAALDEASQPWVEAN